MNANEQNTRMFQHVVKTALILPRPLFERAEKERQAQNVSLDHLVAMALVRHIQKSTTNNSSTISIGETSVAFSIEHGRLISLEALAAEMGTTLNELANAAIQTYVSNSANESHPLAENQGGGCPPSREARMAGVRAAADRAMATGSPLSDLIADEAEDPPKLEVFKSSELLTFEETINTLDRDTKERLTAVLAKLKTSGSVKRFAKVPTNHAELIARLREGFPNFSPFINFIADHLALNLMGDGRLAFPPCLFVGEPGIGKTELAMTLATMFDTGHEIISMASEQTGSTLSGSDRHWVNSKEGRLFETLVYGETANPIVVLDEIDKTTDHWNSPQTLSALYPLLEPRSAAVFKDLAIPELPINTTGVIWIALANGTDSIPAPILSRFQIFHIPKPDEIQCRSIAKNIYGNLLKSATWGPAFNPVLDEGVIDALILLPPRMIRQRLMQALGRAAREKRFDLLPGDIESDAGCRRMRMGF